MIKLTDISKYYYSDTSVALALKKVNLEFKRGEFVVITGESGSGKTTLLNVISGMDTYEEGEMYFWGQSTSAYGDDEWERHRKENISLIYQNYNLIDSYTALENVETVLMIGEGDKLTEKERREKALGYLEQVGLTKQAKQKASHLSSGQKQRLGIARALAKDTDILIADEPTGNLDVENGQQVMALLKKLSEDKLVIVVTHNYEQAADYATRKVRIHDGKVVEDIVVTPSPFDEEERTSEESAGKKESKKKRFALSWKFVNMNRKAQPHRTIFMMMLLIASVLSTYIFFGTFVGNVDDTKTKIIKDDLFANIADNRIVIRKMDDSEITDKDVEKLEGIKRVEQVDKYDAVSDINYFWIEDEDYRTTYEYNENLVSSKKVNTTLVDYTKFMKSVTCINEDALIAGEMPVEFNEVVVPSDDESLIGKEMIFYFANTHFWTDQQNVALTMKITGILGEGEQVYFSEKLCGSMGIKYNLYDNRMRYTKVKTVTYSDGVTPEYVDNNTRDFDAVFVLNEALEGNSVKISQNYFLNLQVDRELNTGEGTVNEAVSEEGVVTIYKLNQEAKDIEVSVIQEGSQSADGVVEVSQEVFDQIYTERESSQASVYVEDYAYVEAVLESILDMGYEAISVYEVSATEYDAQKVQDQMLMLGISMGVLIIVFILSVFVAYAIMKLKKTDFMVFTSLGMGRHMVRQIVYIDLITSVLIADAIAVIIAYALKIYGIEMMANIVKYYSAGYYIIFVVITIIMAICISALFNRFLLRTFRIKGETI